MAVGLTMNTNAPSLLEPCDELFQAFECQLVAYGLGGFVLGIKKGVRVTGPVLVVAFRGCPSSITHIEDLAVREKPEHGRTSRVRIISYGTFTNSKVRQSMVDKNFDPCQVEGFARLNSRKKRRVERQ